MKGAVAHEDETEGRRAGVQAEEGETAKSNEGSPARGGPQIDGLFLPDRESFKPKR